MRANKATLVGLVSLATAVQMGGCPTTGSTEFVLGTSGNTNQIGSTSSVDILAPVNDLSITGGAPVQVDWRAVATTPFATLDVILDRDTTPDNGNETVEFRNLPLTESTALIDTTDLEAGDYFIGVLLRDVGELVASDYAGGRLTVDQRPDLFFTSPRDNFRFDRTQAINPRFDVAWSVSDPDSVISVQVFLDPDGSPNGNEILLRESNSQSGDSFSFDLTTGVFAAGTYQLLALVSDGTNTFPFYAPGSIQLRSRLAGVIDLRGVGVPNSGVSGAVFEGFNPRDNAGTFVSSLKDVDGDGFSDFMALSQFAKPFYQISSQRTGVGEAYLIYGRQNRFSGLINLNSTGTLFRGEIYGGVPQVADPIRPSRGITSFALLSDWDSDGVREFAFGIPFCDSAPIGSLSVDAVAPLDVGGYFRTGAVVIAAGSSLRPDLGFPGRQVLNLAEFGTLAHEAIGCFGYNTIDFDNQNPVGSVTVCDCLESFVGPKSPAGPSGITSSNRHLVDVPAALNAGAIRLGCRFSSLDIFDQFGETVSAFDFDSILISAPNRDPAVSALRAPSVAGAGVISLFYNDVKDGFYPWSNTNAPVANPAFNYPGSLQSIGALNNLLPDGGPYHYIIDDLRLTNAGRAGQFPSSPGYFVDPDDATDPCQRLFDPHMETPDYSVRFWSSTRGARLSNAKGVEDINTDGLLDLLVGAPLTNQGAGACYIVFGRLRDIVRAGEIELEELGLPLDSSDRDSQRVFDGVRVVGAPGDRLGQSQDTAGDFNNDGIPDIVIGSPFVNGRRGGVAVFFGSRDVINLTESDIPFDQIDDRGLGVIFTGESEGDLAGARVATAGDIDGDGNDDLMIAAPDKSVELDTNLDGIIDIDRTSCGVVYLVYGSPELRGTISLGDIGTDRLPGAMFVGANSGDFLGAGLGDQGDRSLGISTAGDVDGDGRGDLLISAVKASPRNRAEAGAVYLLYGTGD